MSKVTSACPSCGEVAPRDTYDIGSGPELCCSFCDWCWGAAGQALNPADADWRCWPEAERLAWSLGEPSNQETVDD